MSVMEPPQNKQQAGNSPVVGSGFGVPDGFSKLAGKLGLASHTLMVICVGVSVAVIGGGVAFGLHQWLAPAASKATRNVGSSSSRSTAEANKPSASSGQQSGADQGTQGSTAGTRGSSPSKGSTSGSSGGSSGGSGSSSCPSGQIGTPPSCYQAPPAPLLAGKQWHLSWNEEFGGSDYDHNKLTPCFDWNYGGCTSTFNNGREHYDPGQIQVSSGTAKLIAQPHSPAYADGACQNSSCTYYSGLLSTARPSASNGSGYLYSFTYGYVEASLKLPATRGFFTAFWMLPTDTSYNYRSEIDILENLGYDNKTMFQTYHYNDRNDNYTPNTGVNNNGACPVTDLSGGFHRFAVDWEPAYVAFYIDGTKCGQFNGDASTIENGPMQIILDLMVDNNWQRSWNEGLTDPTLTRQLEVDYLRVYQQS
ncbi:MAG TPA: glycoside hydrolase family 16 protein [Candidatus Saccharimonadales bacterium]|nr:glycoside hydrolase family 16 protein [Candidatus Saccharimonadales bacterium]